MALSEKQKIKAGEFIPNNRISKKPDSRLRGNDEISKLWRYRKNKKSKPENLSQTTGFQKNQIPAFAGMTDFRFLFWFLFSRE
ncbi:TPA: hypothetical protein WHE73_000402 [Neisseria meningitidis]